MQDILIHARNFREHTDAGEYGVALAARFGASLTALYACPSPVYLAPAYGPELVAVALEGARKLLADALAAGPSFVEWATSRGAAHAEWVVVEGDATDALRQASTCHDLLVLDHLEDDRAASWDVPGTVLGAGVPCILLPRHAAPCKEITRAAIGWNGSPEAMRAVRSALPFLVGHEVLLLRGEEREKFPGLEWYPAFDIEAWLRRHGVHVVAQRVDANPDDVGEALLEAAGRFHADLLVMGAYGRSRFSEWMLGGATRDVLTWAELPVLLQH